MAAGYVVGPGNPTDGFDDQGFVTKRVASDGSERWTHMFVGTGSRSHSAIDSVAIGPNDRVVVVGYYMGTVDFGGQALSLPPDKSTMFVATYSADGELEWVRTLNDSAFPYGLTVDATGRIFVTGSFARSTLDFNGALFREADGDLDTFLVADDAQGALLWGTAFQASAPGTVDGAGPVASGIALGANGDVLVTGTFSAPASVGGAVLYPETRIRTFLTRFRNDGLYVASRTIGPASPITSSLAEITVDVGGHIIIQQVETDESGVSTGPESNGALATLRVFDDGHHELWASQLRNYGGYSPQVRTLATTPSGLIVSSAWTDSPYNADNRAAVPGSMEVVAYDVSGNVGRAAFGARHFAAPQSTLARATAVASTGALAFTGAFGGTVDFGTGALKTRGQDDTDIYIVAVDPPAYVPQAD